MSAPICPYCDNPSRLVGGVSVYRHRKDLALKQFWLCENCDAWVGCHDGTIKPLGRLANKELRDAKQRAHAAFDPLWQAKIRRDRVPKKVARGAGYKWLAGQLGIDREHCHIGMFDVPTCRRVVDICASVRRREPATC